MSLNRETRTPKNRIGDLPELRATADQREVNLCTVHFIMYCRIQRLSFQPFLGM